MGKELHGWIQTSKDGEVSLRRSAHARKAVSAGPRRSVLAGRLQGQAAAVVQFSHVLLQAFPGLQTFVQEDAEHVTLLHAWLPPEQRRHSEDAPF